MFISEHVTELLQTDKSLSYLSVSYHSDEYLKYFGFWDHKNELNAGISTFDFNLIESRGPHSLGLFSLQFAISYSSIVVSSVTLKLQI